MRELVAARLSTQRTERLFVNLSDSIPSHITLMAQRLTVIIESLELVLYIISFHVLGQSDLRRIQSPFSLYIPPPHSFFA